MSIPAQAVPLILPLITAMDAHVPALSQWAPYFAAQIDHETGCGWRPAMCWSPKAELKTSREQGVGLAQITRTWRTDDSLRFDALAELKAKYPTQLASVTWSSPSLRLVETQLVIFSLKLRETWAVVKTFNAKDPLPFQIVAHNRGTGGIAAERAKCKTTPGCDPGRWWGHVEKTCTASRTPLYGGRSACDISRHYPRDVLLVRAPKYENYWVQHKLPFARYHSISML